MAKPFPFRCLVCKSEKGTQPAAFGSTETWYHIEDEDGNQGSFCSQTCREAYKRFSRIQQLTLIWPGYWEATKCLHRAGPNNPGRDSAGDIAYGIRWNSAEPVKHQTLTLVEIEVQR